MGKHRTRRGIRYRLCGLYWARNTGSDEYEPSTNKGEVVGPRDQPASKGVSFSAFLGVGSADGVNGDFMYRFFRVVRRACSSEWVLWIMVLHSYQVRHSTVKSEKL